MGVDSDRVRQKCAYITEQVASIKELIRSKPGKDIVSDPWLIRGLKYALQTATESLIDVCYHIAAKHFGHAAKDARDAVHCLVEHGVIEGKNEVLYSSMIGFRNRVVHGYQEVSAHKVYEIASSDLDDLLRFVREINLFLTRLETERTIGS